MSYSGYTVYVKNENHEDIVCFNVPAKIRGRIQNELICVPKDYEVEEKEKADKEFRLSLEKAEEEEEEPWY